MVEKFGDPYILQKGLDGTVLEVKGKTLAKLTPEEGDTSVCEHFLRELRIAPSTMKIESYCKILAYRDGYLEYPMKIRIVKVLPIELFTKLENIQT